MIVMKRRDFSFDLGAGMLMSAMPVRGHFDCSLETVAGVLRVISVAPEGNVVAAAWTPAGPVRVRLVDVGAAPGTFRWRVEADQYAGLFWLCAGLFGSTEPAVAAALDGGVDVRLDTLVFAYSLYLTGCACRGADESLRGWERRAGGHVAMDLEVGSLRSAVLSGEATVAEWPRASRRGLKPYGALRLRRHGGGVRLRLLGALRACVSREPRWEPATRRDRGSLYEALLQLARVRQIHFDWFAFRHPGAPLDEYRDYLETLWALVAAAPVAGTAGSARASAAVCVTVVAKQVMQIAVWSAKGDYVETWLADRVR
jgi:hypothetical protein